MATSLPNIERFYIYQDNENVDTHWRKWLAKFENLVCALDITSDARKKALLLHYGGEEIYKIYESFSDVKKRHWFSHRRWTKRIQITMFL